MTIKVTCICGKCDLTKALNRDFTIKEIKEILKPAEFKKFQKWFRGQTCEINKKGELVVYKHDFIRFLQDKEPFD